MKRAHGYTVHCSYILILRCNTEELKTVFILDSVEFTVNPRFLYLTKTYVACLRDNVSPHLFIRSMLIQASVYLPEQCRLIFYGERENIKPAFSELYKLSLQI